MLGLARNNTTGEPLHEIRGKVAAYLYEQFSTENSPLGRLDRWTQRRISEENLAKVALVLESDDPTEHCYQNLIREIDTEAETGIYLTRLGAKTAELRRLVDEPGVSGKLYQVVPKIAPVLFPDELAHSSKNLDIVWVTIEARYDRAYLDAKVSELIVTHLLDNEHAAKDMTDALRALLYAYHEDLARRQCQLPLLLNERAIGDLVMMISELSDRSGDYEQRVIDICDRAGT
jgi:hypothetical protein